ncbi:MAG: glycosyltransferase family 39 protein [bacterium]
MINIKKWKRYYLNYFDFRNNIVNKFRKNFQLNSRHLFLLVIILGTFLKLLAFPNIPAGIIQDEASAGYESLSLLQSGTDRWGNSWPVYFPSWGSGQNVLLSYLSMPFIKIFGLNASSIRMVPLILGILTPILFYFSVKKAFNKRTALIATIFLEFWPWHFMSSRWALESNLLPVCLLSGTYLVQLSLGYQDKLKKNWRQYLIHYMALIPFALAFYAYGLAIIVVPILLIAIFIFYRKIILAQLKSWLVSIAFFIITAFPFGLYLIKNYLLKTTLPGEKYLPFSIPLQQVTRYTEVKESIFKTIYHNLLFFKHGFNDQIPTNITLPYLNFPYLGIFLCLLGLTIYLLIQWQCPKENIVIQLRSLFQHLINKLKLFLLQKQLINIYLLWLIASAFLIFFMPLNTNRFNSFFLPMIAFAAYGTVYLWQHIQKTIFKIFFRIGLVAYLVIFSLLFFFNYFTNYAQKTAADFNDNFDQILTIAEGETLPNEEIAITPDIGFSYIYILFYRQPRSEEFRQNASYPAPFGIYQVTSYRNYIFDPAYLSLPDQKNFTYILKDTTKIDNYCPMNKQSIIYRDQLWTVGRCLNSEN